MKRTSTHFLRIAIIGIGLIALIFGIFLVPTLGSDIVDAFPNLAYIHFPIMIGMYAAAIPFYIILYQGFKLLRHIDANTAFSELSIRALRTIKRGAVAIGIIYLALVPILFYPIAEADDAPGLIIVGMVIAAIPFVFAVFSSVLEKLLQNAIEFKHENELTV
jgi:hypothetical protein